MQCLVYVIASDLQRHLVGYDNSWSDL